MIKIKPEPPFWFIALVQVRQGARLRTVPPPIIWKDESLVAQGHANVLKHLHPPSSVLAESNLPPLLDFLKSVTFCQKGIMRKWLFRSLTSFFDRSRLVLLPHPYPLPPENIPFWMFQYYFLLKLLLIC